MKENDSNDSDFPRLHADLVIKLPIFFYLDEDDSDTAGSVSDARRTSIVEKDLDLEASLARNSGNSSR